MGKKDPRVDQYIADAEEFARPILTHLRKLIHQACPEVEEDIKWSMPFFLLQGPFCHMAAFKQHCAFGFWRGLDVVGDAEKADAAMGHLGRIAKRSDLPSDATMLGYLRKAREIRQAAGAPAKRATRTAKSELETPDDLKTALKKNKRAAATFDAFSPSHRREYIVWITEAKRPETRQRRLETAIAWMAEGKSQNWRYER